MTKQTLITPNEVIEYTALKVPFNVCTFRQIKPVEIFEFDNCLGADFYADLLGALADYSTATTYASGSSYNTGEVVKHAGLLWQAQIDGVTSQPGTSNTDWDHPPKFAGDCATVYETMWCVYLGPYLAYTVLHNRLPFIRSLITDRGVMEGNGSQYQARTPEEFDSLKHATTNQKAITWRNFTRWINKDAQKDNDCFANYKPFLDNEGSCKSSTECRASRKRSGVYRFG